MRLAQRAQVAPGADQRVLDGVLGPPVIAQDQRRGREQAVHAGSSQRRESLAVAVGRRADQVLDVH